MIQLTMSGVLDSLRIEAYAAHSRGNSAADLLKTVREDPNILILDPKKEIKSFRVALSVPLGTKRGRGRGSAIDSVLDAVDAFYGEVLQRLKAWTAAPPKMREIIEVATEETPSLASTALSSQDGIEPADKPGEPDNESAAPASSESRPQVVLPETHDSADAPTEDESSGV